VSRVFPREVRALQERPDHLGFVGAAPISRLVQQGLIVAAFVAVPPLTVPQRREYLVALQTDTQKPRRCSVCPQLPALPA
jgi:hypothetical protein